MRLTHHEIPNWKNGNQTHCERTVFGFEIVWIEDRLNRRSSASQNRLDAKSSRSKGCDLHFALYRSLQTRTGNVEIRIVEFTLWMCVRRTKGAPDGAQICQVQLQTSKSCNKRLVRHPRDQTENRTEDNWEQRRFVINSADRMAASCSIGLFSTDRWMAVQARAQVKLRLLSRRVLHSLCYIVCATNLIWKGARIWGNQEREIMTDERGESGGEGWEVRL